MEEPIVEYVTVMDLSPADTLEDVKNVMNVKHGTTLRDVLLYAYIFNGKKYAKLRLCLHGGSQGGELGHGLLIGGRFYDHDTAEHDWGIAKNFWRDIVIVGCGAARGKEGEAYCSAIAKHANSVVFASDDIQNFPFVKGKPKTVRLPRIWSGKVYGFNPNGSKFPVHYKIT
jgi:hypothetical protein